MSHTLFESYTAEIARAIIALVAVCVLAIFILKSMARRGVGMRSDSGAVRVIQRIALEPRRSLYLVRAGSRLLLIGISEGGAPQLLAELDPKIVAEQKELPKPLNRFGETLRRIIDQKSGDLSDARRSRRCSND
ncbi:MAG: flagellar biosynthetic protein FliO [Deltaproteobacteria bacterium]|nr:flagellar biosynthetic protein FliO [Deltaproteobacteria bacterium]